MLLMEPLPFDFDDKRIQDLFDEMVRELQDTDENQSSLKRDYQRRQLIDVKINSLYVRNHLYLKQHGN